MFIHLHKLFIFALLCFYLLRPKNFLNFALNFKIWQYFFMLLLPLLVAHSTNTRVVDLWRPLTSDLFDIFNVFPPRQQLKLKFSMSVVILLVWCARFHYRQLQRIRWCSTSCVFFFFFLLFFCFFTGSQNERVPQRVTTVPKCSMTRQLQTYHTYVTFPLLLSHAKRLRPTTNWMKIKFKI